MNNKFDELTKQMAQSVTRRGALKKLGVGLVGPAFAAFGLANRGHAQSNCLPGGYSCSNNSECCSRKCEWHWYPYPYSQKGLKVRTCNP
jgi:UPF0506